MDKREENIVEAAIAVFSRYGIKRTTMNDIAAEAGIVRQTLYNVFANKDEILRAAIRLHADKVVSRIESACTPESALSERLDIVAKHLVIEPFDMVHASPHADEIMEGFNEAARQELLAANALYATMMEGLLAPYETQIESVGLTVSSLADLSVHAWDGFKKKARSKNHLQELLETFHVLFLAAVQKEQ